MEATSVFLAVRSSDDVVASVAESQEVFSLWSAPRLYTEVHRACKNIFKSWLTSSVFGSGAAPVIGIIIENGVYRPDGWIIEILCCCNSLKCVINPVVNPIPVYSHLNA
jgi:hypothetical protein